MLKPITAGFRVATRLILVAILLGMLAYLGLFAYFMIGRSWSLPVILTAGHERVVAVQRDLIERKLRLADVRDRISGLRRQAAELEAARDSARVIAASVDASMAEERKLLDVETGAMEKVRTILNAESQAATGMLGDLRREARPAADLKAGLIDRTRFLAELLLQVNLSINVSNISAKLAEIEVQAAGIAKRERNLREVALAGKGHPKAAPGFEEATKVDQLYKARVTLAHYEAERRRNAQSLASLERLEGELSTAIDTLSLSPLAGAPAKPTVVVFVPYENAGYEPGQQVYRCRLWLVSCSPIGRVTALADGEAMLPHPLFGRQVRGALYAVDADVAAAKDALLFSTKPFFL